MASNYVGQTAVCHVPADSDDPPEAEVAFPDGQVQAIEPVLTDDGRWGVEAGPFYQEGECVITIGGEVAGTIDVVRFPEFVHVTKPVLIANALKNLKLAGVSGADAEEMTAPPPPTAEDIEIARRVLIRAGLTPEVG